MTTNLFGLPYRCELLSYVDPWRLESQCQTGHASIETSRADHPIASNLNLADLLKGKAEFSDRYDPNEVIYRH